MVMRCVCDMLGDTNFKSFDSSKSTVIYSSIMASSLHQVGHCIHFDNTHSANETYLEMLVVNKIFSISYLDGLINTQHF